jgi:hypothetical protein
LGGDYGGLEEGAEGGVDGLDRELEEAIYPGRFDSHVCFDYSWNMITVSTIEPLPAKDKYSISGRRS